MNILVHSVNVLESHVEHGVFRFNLSDAVDFFGCSTVGASLTLRIGLKTTNGPYSVQYSSYPPQIPISAIPPSTAATVSSNGRARKR